MIGNGHIELLKSTVKSKPVYYIPSLPKFKPYLTVERNVSAQAVSSATVH